MELVKFKNDGGVVTIDIDIGGLVTWKYKYACDNGTFSKNSQDNGPFVHTLGLPHELNNDIDIWDVSLANVSDTEQEYTAKIIWRQDGVEIHKWQKPGTLQADSAEIERGNAFLTGS